LKWNYVLKEGLEGFFRAKTAAVVAVITMTGSLILIGVFAVVTLNLVSIVDSLRARIELEVFVDKGRDDNGIQELRHQLEATVGVAAVRYVSPEEAIEIFRNEFGNDFLQLLESNPLPPSFRISLKPPYQHSLEAQRIAGELRTLEGVDEVVYRKEFVQVLERYISLAVTVDLVLGFLVFAGSVFVVVNQVRLVAFAKRRIIETMQLVGASRAFVRGPFVIQGILQGFLGGSLAAAAIYLGDRLLFGEFEVLIRIPLEFYVALFCTGILVGLGAAYLGVRRFVD